MGKYIFKITTQEFNVSKDELLTSDLVKSAEKKTSLEFFCDFF